MKLEPHEVLIRAANPDDLTSVAAILSTLGRLVTEEEARSRFARLEASSADSILVAEHLERIIGVMTLHTSEMLHRSGPVGRVVALAVQPDYRGRGAGGMLLEAGVRHFQQAGCVAVELTSNLRRTEAHAFYRKHGFHETSYRFWRDIR